MFNKDIVIKCGFQTIHSNYTLTNNKGKKLAESGHVNLVTELDNDRSVKNGFCECPVGASEKCKHIAAVIHYINNEESFSKTNFPQQWGKPTKIGQEKYKKGKRINELFSHQKKKIKMASINHHDLVDNYNILSIPCSLSILIKEELISEEDRQYNNYLNDIINKLEKEEIRLKNVQYINNIIRYQLCNITYNLQPSNFPLNQNIHKIYYSDIVVTHDKIQIIFNETIEQSHSDQWKKYRSIRISATKCHKIKTCRNLSEEGQTRIAEVISEDLNLFGKAAVNTAYGLNTENVAFEVYCEMFNAVTIKCGLIIHAKYPWLCASPDGLVLSKEGDIYKVLEIKCL
ncbi:hypothetical protein ACI65C_004739 [Semiaphis heraclei]